MAEQLSRKIFRNLMLPLLLLLSAVLAYSEYYDKLGLALVKDNIQHVNKWIFTFFACIATFMVHRAINAIVDWYGTNIAEKTATTLDDEFLPLARRLVVFLIWVLAALIVLSRFGINTSGIIAALGVSSLAIALAAQDTISNIISGFLIIVDRPFRINDEIKLPSGEKVRVLFIGLRRSKFISEDGAIIIVPNLELSKSKITNYTYGREGKNGS